MEYIIKEIQDTILENQLDVAQQKCKDAIDRCRDDVDFLQLAEICVVAKLPELAEKLLNREFQDQYSGRKKYVLGNVFFALGKPEEACDLYKEAMSSGYSVYDCLMKLSAVCTTLGKINEAEMYLCRAAEEESQNPIPAALLYRQAIERGRYEDAILYSEMVIERANASYASYHSKFSALIISKRFHEAEKFLLSCKTLFGDKGEYILDTASMFAMQSRFEDARSLLDQNDQLKTSYKYLKLRAQLALSMKNEEETSIFQKELFDRYRDRNAAFVLATLSLKNGDFSEAKVYLQTLVTDERADRLYYSALFQNAACAKLLDEEGWEDDVRKIIVKYDNAIERNPLNFYLFKFEAGCYRLLGDEVRAKRCDEIVRITAELLERSPETAGL